jgi:hypothetical protein
MHQRPFSMPPTPADPPALDWGRAGRGARDLAVMSDLTGSAVGGAHDSPPDDDMHEAIDATALELQELQAELVEWQERAENAEADAAAQRAAAAALQRAVAAAEQRADSAEERTRAAEASMANISERYEESQVHNGPSKHYLCPSLCGPRDVQERVILLQGDLEDARAAVALASSAAATGAGPAAAPGPQGIDAGAAAAAAAAAGAAAQQQQARAVADAVAALSAERATVAALRTEVTTLRADREREVRLPPPPPPPLPPPSPSPRSCQPQRRLTFYAHAARGRAGRALDCVPAWAARKAAGIDAQRRGLDAFAAREGGPRRRWCWRRCCWRNPYNATCDCGPGSKAAGPSGDRSERRRAGAAGGGGAQGTRGEGGCVDPFEVFFLLWEA